jgi:hypothetical protein
MGAHAAAPLVVRADGVSSGRLVAGALGCPTCNLTWKVIMEIANFGTRNMEPARPLPPPDVIAACLSLTEPATIAIDGDVTADLAPLSTVYGATIVALDPSFAIDDATIIAGAPRVPFNASLRGVILARAGRNAAFIDSAVNALAQDGRVLLRADVPMHSGLAELARDNDWRVAEKIATASLVGIQRR